MPKKAKKREDYQQIARRVLDTIAPDAEPKRNVKSPIKRKIVGKRSAR